MDRDSLTLAATQPSAPEERRRGEDPMVGRTFDRYQIVEQVGSGGMSVVYRGFDRVLDREVAVKVLHPHLAAKEDSRRRFSREARAVARLHHPNILEIYDFNGDEASEAYIVTEYIRGETLRAFAERERFHPPEIGVMAAHELASALEHAHDIGVIHRDLKPENVMIRRDGVLKLMDFGIAKVLDRDERMTMTGALVGSPAHMAPEIIEGQEAGREADVFSLGTILYWLVCGRLPFCGNNTTQTLKLILEGTYEDPRVQNPAVSDRLAAVIARCLSRQPSDRYAGAGEVREALALVLDEAGVDRPGETLGTFLADPPGIRLSFQARLVERLLEEARSLLAEGRLAKALSALNRVLALEPKHAPAEALLEAMRRRKRLGRRLSLAGAALAAACGLGAGLWLLLPLLDRPPTPVAATPGAALPMAAAATAPLAVAPAPAPPEVVAPAPAASPETVSTVAPAVAARIPEEPAPAVRVIEPLARLQPGVVARLAPLKRPEAIRPAAALGNLAIKVFPYAPIDLDGTVVNSHTPHFEGRVSVGTHHVRIESPCCKTWEKDIEVVAEGPGPTFVARLEPKPALLTVVSREDVDVMVGNLYRGKASASVKDPIPVPLPDGAYRGSVAVRFYREGYRDKVEEIAFEAGRHARHDVELEKR